jgi:hypothetical protein
MDLDAVLSRKLTSLFPDPDIRDEVINTLNLYGLEKHEQEPIRIRLAVLKLSGDDVEQVKINTAYAKQDFRDVLVWAEYPRQSKKWSVPDGPKKQKLVAADRAEYEEWLER